VSVKRAILSWVLCLGSSQAVSAERYWPNWMALPTLELGATFSGKQNSPIVVGRMVPSAVVRLQSPVDHPDSGETVLKNTSDFILMSGRSDLTFCTSDLNGNRKSGTDSLGRMLGLFRCFADENRDGFADYWYNEVTYHKRTLEPFTSTGLPIKKIRFSAKTAYEKQDDKSYFDYFPIGFEHHYKKKNGLEHICFEMFLYSDGSFYEGSWIKQDGKAFDKCYPIDQRVFDAFTHKIEIVSRDQKMTTFRVVEKGEKIRIR
jgi:hypothetical protein